MIISFKYYFKVQKGVSNVQVALNVQMSKDKNSFYIDFNLVTDQCYMKYNFDKLVCMGLVVIMLRDHSNYPLIYIY